MLDRRAIALLSGVGAAALINKAAKADTPFTTFSYPTTLPDGTSTTPSSQTTPARSGENWANVKDFGAKGDGSTDDTLAIQDAVNWTVTNVNGRGVIFFPVGTYIVSSPIEYGATTQVPGIHFLGEGTLSNIQGSMAGQAILSRSVGPSNTFATITIEKLKITNNGVLGAAILLGCSTNGTSVKDCWIHADIGISCGEFVSPTQVTSAATTSGMTLTFAAGVPSLVIDNYNNGLGSFVNVSDVTTPGSITGGTTVAGVTSTTVTLSQSVAGTVGNGDTIQFTFAETESIRGEWSVSINNCHLEAHHDYIPGSFGIALLENSTAMNVDMNTYDHAIRMAGNSNAVVNAHIEVCRKAYVLGMMANGVVWPLSNYVILDVGSESNAICIEAQTSCGFGLISGGGQNAAKYASPYSGSVPVSGVSVTGSVSGATGTAAIAYNTSHGQYEMTLTSVSGTFVQGDNVGDGVNIPLLTNITGFVSGSGGSGSVCTVDGCAEYGIHGSGFLSNTVIAAIGMQGYYNQAAIDTGTNTGGNNLTFISSSALNSNASKPAWVTTTIAGDVEFINCNINEPEYAFNNLRPYPYAQRGDEFLVNNSSTSTFAATVDGAGSNVVRALAKSVVTGTTNNTTAVGNNTLHFSSTPAGIVNGMVVGDSTLRIGSGVQPFPVGTVVTSQTATTVVLSANATTQVGNGDLIGFVLWTVTG